MLPPPPHLAQARDSPPYVPQQAALDDEMSPLMPFLDIFDTATPNGVTHRDMLAWRPNYVYAKMSF